ncbi:hypothetical protein BK146_06110 [Paenibacillus sp. FSL R7-0333]|nr:hypothetical protein BK146_06110 [Paenibacillus sp. FSL R7-0333]
MASRGSEAAGWHGKQADWMGAEMKGINPFESAESDQLVKNGAGNRVAIALCAIEIHKTPY